MDSNQGRINCFKRLISRFDKLQQCKGKDLKNLKHTINNGPQKLENLFAELHLSEIQQLIVDIQSFPEVKVIIPSTSSQQFVDDKETYSLEFLKETDFPKLQEIKFYKSQTPLRDGQLANLLKFPGLSLTSISLSKQPAQILEEKDLSLFETVQWPQLTKLNLKGKKLGALPFKILTLRAETIWYNLSYLNLSQCSLTDSAFRFLSELSFPNLQKLRLSDNMVTNLGLKYLGEAQWSQLTTLFINENRDVRYQGFKELHRADWPYLEKLAISQKNGAFMNYVTINQLLFICKIQLKSLQIEDKITISLQESLEDSEGDIREQCVDIDVMSIKGFGSYFAGEDGGGGQGEEEGEEEEDMFVNSPERILSYLEQKKENIRFQPTLSVKLGRSLQLNKYCLDPWMSYGYHLKKLPIRGNLHKIKIKIHHQRSEQMENNE